MIVHFKAEGKAPGAVDKVPFHNFDPAPMVKYLVKIRRSSNVKLPRELIFLYLFYGDAFDGINDWLPIDRGYQRRIKRREAILDRKSPRESDQIAESLDQVVKAIEKDNLDLARLILKHTLEAADPKLLELRRDRIAVLENRIQDRSRTLAINKRLPSALRDDVLLLPLDNKSISKALRLRCEFNFPNPAKFLKGIGTWTHGRNGLLAPEGLEEFPGKQWQNEVEIRADIYENKKAMSARFRIHLPADGPVVDVFGLQFLGARFLFVQLDDLSVQTRYVKSLKDFKDYMPTLREIVKNKNELQEDQQKDQQNVWYFLPGANYDFALDVKPAGPGWRSFTVRVNGQTVFDKILRIQRGSKTSLAIRAIGRVTLKKLRFTGKPAL